ncbi:MAG TPA: ribosome silencing factor, partial [Pyrinomonadaceae bacterium]|nr:ribosome silencing factor [Pyrinomonadaceae bacterium]
MKQNEPTPEQNARTTKKRASLKEETMEETHATPQVQGAGAPAEEGFDSRVELALHAASDKKALELIVLDLRAVASFTDFFVITSGTNVRQVQAIADEITERLKRAGTRAARVEGYNTAEWVLVDYGDFIVHVFEEKARR